MVTVTGWGVDLSHNTYGFVKFVCLSSSSAQKTTVRAMEVFDGSVSSQAMEVVVEICTLILSNETNNEFLAPSKKIKKNWDGKLEMI